MNRRILTCIVLAIAFAVSPAVTADESSPGPETPDPVAARSSATFQVSPSGNDTNPCTQAAPCREIRQALTLVGPGDTIEVADGQYKGFDVDNKDGLPGQPITIRATGTGAIVVNTTDRPDNRDTIFVTFSDWVVIDGLRSFDATRAAVRVDQASNVTIRNGIFGNNTRWGIFTDFSDDVLIEANECYGSRIEHGIYVSNSVDRPTVRGNLVHDNNANGLHFNGDLSAGGDGLITGALVENNIIWGNGAAGGAGINMDGPQDSVIRNNLIYDNHAGGITQYIIDASAGPARNKIYHNTIDQASNGRWALLITGSTGPMEVRNNIFYNRNTARGGISFGGPTDVSNTNSDYNIMDKVTTDDGNTVLTLAEWQAQGHELRSSSSTPAQLWTNPGVDYHLLPTSPAVDAGQNITSVSSDIEGNIRPMGNASDIGAYEFPSTPPGFSVSAYANPSFGQAPLTVFFFANASGVKPPFTYDWDFGDANSSTQQNPVKTYTQAGNYTAKVTAHAQNPTKNITTSLKITVLPPTPGGQVLTDVVLTPGNATLDKGGQKTFVAKALDQDGKEILLGLTWEWTLAPATLGNLSSTTGLNRTTFTAGQTADEGSLTVLATQGPRVKAAKAAIKVVESPTPGKPPAVRILAPTEGQTVTNIALVSLNTSANVVRVEFWVNGQDQATDVAAPFEWSWDTRLIADGTKIVRATAYNATGGFAHDEVTVTVENGTPKEPTISGTPPWFFTLLALFAVLMVITGVVWAVAAMRRKKRRREQWRQKQFANQEPTR